MTMFRAVVSERLTSFMNHSVLVNEQCLRSSHK